MSRDACQAGVRLLNCHMLFLRGAAPATWPRVLAFLVMGITLLFQGWPGPVHAQGAATSQAQTQGSVSVAQVETLLAQGRLDQAGDLLQALIAADHDHARAHFLAASMALMGERYGLAREELGVAEYLSPDMSFASAAEYEALRARLAARGRPVGDAPARPAPLGGGIQWAAVITALVLGGVLPWFVMSSGSLGLSGLGARLARRVGPLRRRWTHRQVD